MKRAPALPIRSVAYWLAVSCLVVSASIYVVLRRPTSSYVVEAMFGRPVASPNVLVLLAGGAVRVSPA